MVVTFVAYYILRFVRILHLMLTLTCISSVIVRHIEYLLTEPLGFGCKTGAILHTSFHARVQNRVQNFDIISMRTLVI